MLSNTIKELITFPLLSLFLVYIFYCSPIYLTNILRGTVLASGDILVNKTDRNSYLNKAK